MTLVHEIKPLGSMNSSGLWLTRNTLSCEFKALDAMHSLRLSMIRKTPSQEFNALDAMNISGLDSRITPVGSFNQKHL